MTQSLNPLITITFHGSASTDKHSDATPSGNYRHPAPPPPPHPPPPPPSLLLSNHFWLQVFAVLIWQCSELISSPPPRTPPPPHPSWLLSNHFWLQVFAVLIWQCSELISSPPPPTTPNLSQWQWLCKSHHSVSYQMKAAWNAGDLHVSDILTNCCVSVRCNVHTVYRP